MLGDWAGQKLNSPKKNQTCNFTYVNRTKK